MKQNKNAPCRRMSLRRRAASLVGLGLGVVGSGAAAQDDFCAEIRRFERASFETGKDGQRVRRTMEYHWSGVWMADFRWECRHPNEPARRLCRYLDGRTSREFHSHLPMQILQCYGYGFPKPHVEWSSWTAVIPLREKLEDRRAVLEVDIGRHEPTHDAIRFTIIPDEEDVWPEPSALTDELDAKPAEQRR